ncbi:hypothetical protein CR513_00170, partial [Mucuna pruriens]
MKPSCGVGHVELALAGMTSSNRDVFSAETPLVSTLASRDIFGWPRCIRSLSYWPGRLAQYPLYGLPPNYTPLVNNNTNPHMSTSNPQNLAQPQDPNCRTNYAQTFIPTPTHDAPNPQFINPTPIVILHPNQYKDPHSTKMLQLFEERLKAIEGPNYFDFNVANMCLIPNVVIPPKFKLPKFDKYKGNTYPKNHLTMYCKKMASDAHDDKILINFFQESLMRGALRWYMSLEHGCVQT